jgi:hypothetical protein
MKILINRLRDNGTQTIGLGALFIDGVSIFTFVTLELAWKDNKNNISCIPAGDYLCKVRYSEKYGRHLHVLNVPAREFILFHWGNYYANTNGCILVGERFAKIDKDDQLDITNSKNTFNKLMGYIEDVDKIKLTITPALL